MQIFTIAITQTLVIESWMHVQRMSYKARGGNAIVTGSSSFQLTPGVATLSGPTVLEEGQSEVITAFPQAYVDGLILNPNGNIIDIQIYLQ